MASDFSILRIQCHHVDRAANPENRSELAVNKERSRSWGMQRNPQPCFSFSLRFTRTFRHKHTALELKRHNALTWRGREKKRCLFTSVAKRHHNKVMAKIADPSSLFLLSVYDAEDTLCQVTAK